MTKNITFTSQTDLAKYLSQVDSSLSQAKCKQLITLIFDRIKAELLADKKVHINGFANFSLKEKSGGTLRTSPEKNNRSKINGTIMYAASKTPVVAFSPQFKKIIKINYRSHAPKIFQ
jgi:nucleoid DNA-binding protein